ncbi:unnamed protein product, partial [marine sediment metagenome]
LNDSTNKLLTFEEYEQVGFTIKNYIEVHAGSVKDHWTNETADQYSAGGAGAVVTDEYTQRMYPPASIELAANGAISQV